jgi:hypothetical protein
MPDIQAACNVLLNCCLIYLSAERSSALCSVVSSGVCLCSRVRSYGSPRMVCLYEVPMWRSVPPWACNCILGTSFHRPEEAFGLSVGDTMDGGVLYVLGAGASLLLVSKTVPDGMRMQKHLPSFLFHILNFLFTHSRIPNYALA